MNYDVPIFDPIHARSEGNFFPGNSRTKRLVLIQQNG